METARTDAVEALRLARYFVRQAEAERISAIRCWVRSSGWSRRLFPSISRKSSAGRASMPGRRRPSGQALGRKDTSESVLTRDLRAALARLNPGLPPSAIDDSMRALTVHDFSRSMVQHNQDFYRLIRNGVPISYRDAAGKRRDARARVIDFDNKPGSNRFLAVRELKLTGLRTPNYNRLRRKLARLLGRECHRARLPSQRLFDRFERTGRSFRRYRAAGRAPACHWAEFRPTRASPARPAR
jgi:Type I restriction enzyme R protein N terminus (HSDR_N)